MAGHSYHSMYGSEQYEEFLLHMLDCENLSNGICTYTVVRLEIRSQKYTKLQQNVC
jgi:hypothetical protein